MVLLWLWCRPAAVALIGLLAWEPPYTSGVALKKAKKKAKQNVCLAILRKQMCALYQGRCRPPSTLRHGAGAPDFPSLPPTLAHIPFPGSTHASWEMSPSPPRLHHLCPAPLPRAWQDTCLACRQACRFTCYPACEQQLVSCPLWVPCP